VTKQGLFATISVSIYVIQGKILDSQPTSSSTRAYGRFITIFIALVIAGIGIVQWRQAPELFHFRFNSFALLSLLSVLANIVVLIKVSRIQGRVEGLRWFVLFVYSAMIYGISEVMLRFSSMPVAGIFWTSISSIGITLIPLSIYFFVAEYIGQRNRQPMLFSLFIISAGIFNFIGGNASLLYIADPAKAILFPWGYNNQVGPAYGIYIVWIGVLSLTALYRLYRFRRGATQELIRRQSLLFMFAIGIPIVVGIVNDGLLPVFGHLTIPLAVVAQTSASILIAYGLHKYRLFEIDPERLSSNILLTMNEAVIITRPDYTIEQINAKAEQLLQVNPGEAYGQSFSGYFGQHGWSNVLSTVQSQSHGATAPRLGNLKLLGSRGRETPVRVVGTVLRETNELAVYIFVVSDITELASSYSSLESKNRILRDNKTELARLLDESRNLQAQLAKEKASVEHTVEVRTSELVAAQTELKNAERLKSEFIALSSHNLRTPLTVFRGGLELIKTTRLTKQQTEVIDMIASSTVRLEQFVDDMLIISRLEAGEQLIQVPAPIDTVLQPLLIEALAQARNKKLTFAIELASADAVIACSSLRLQSAFRNILDNAFKFTTDGQVKLSTSVKGRKVIVSISDTGIGIDPSELPKVFRKFHRGTDVMEYNYEGEGIGLYLVQLIIVDHHGTIKIVSKPGSGTTVTVTLPLHK
jgi:signal transduction histidine kinase